MSSIRIVMKSGKVHDFPHEGRAGGSYTKSLRFEGAFAIVENEWGHRFAVPAEDVEHIEETPSR